MKRREVPTPEGEMPAHLRRFRFWEWVSDDDPDVAEAMAMPPSPRGADGTPNDLQHPTVGAWLAVQIRARLAWSEAGRQWCVDNDHDGDWYELTRPGPVVDR